MFDSARHISRTRRVMWAILVCATAASTAGNVTRAFAHLDPAQMVGPLVAAAVPPLALLSLTHLTGLWSRITARGVTYWCFLVMIACITAAAFRLSFAALRDLAMQYGYVHGDAALFPLILDGLVAVCTLGLVMLARISDASRRDATPQSAGGEAADAPPEARIGVLTSGDAGEAGVSGAAGAPRSIAASPPTAVRHGGAAGPRCVAERGQGDANQVASPASQHASPASAAAAALKRGDASDLHRQRALRVVESRRTTVSFDVVYTVLSRIADGESSRVVASRVGVSPSSVQRIVKAAEDVTVG